MFNINEKIANGAQAITMKTYKVAVIIANACTVVAKGATKRQIKALERENQRIVSTVIGLECRKVRNAQKIATLNNYVNYGFGVSLD